MPGRRLRRIDQADRGGEQPGHDAELQPGHRTADRVCCRNTNIDAVWIVGHARRRGLGHPGRGNRCQPVHQGRRSARSCGFKGSADTLTKAKVTNNGWGIATVTARNPQDQGNAQVIFKQGGSGWSVADCGSDFTGDGIPQDVLTALGA